MKKGGFGLKDAPRMWRIRLHKQLTGLCMKAPQAGKSIYLKWTPIRRSFSREGDMTLKQLSNMGS